MPKIWRIKPIEEARVCRIADHTGLPGPLARALALRGHDASGEVDQFLQPRLAGLSDPFLLPDMEQAVDRLWKAVDAGESIVVFGDYDVDGISAAALLTRVLRVLGATVEAFVPDRLDEGYGLSQDALDRCLEERRPQLIVTVDCGTNSVVSVAHARKMGIDVIITDHHEPESQYADACALINPKLGSLTDQKNLTDLSGVGIAFKLAHALVKHGRDAGRTSAQSVDLKDYLDLAALGTVTDLVPLVGENRILVRNGLTGLAETRWAGLRALKEVCGMRGMPTAYHLGFQLGPRINAAGRIGQPMQALQLLTTDQAKEAREIASLLDRTNQERRRVEQTMAEEAFAEIDSYFDQAADFGLVVARAGWHPGVVGIVASRVARHYNRPAIIMGIDDGSARGSCRSIDAFDVLEGLRACDGLLNKYGGHKMAAGLELKSEMLEDFRLAFNEAAAQTLRTMDLRPVLQIDARVTAADLGWDFFRQLQRLHPFGQNNPEPVWMLEGVDLAGTPRTVGQGHLKCAISAKGQRFEAIAFGYPIEQLPSGRLDLAFTLQENYWNGNSTLQLQIRDIRAAEQ